MKAVLTSLLFLVLVHTNVRAQDTNAAQERANQRVASMTTSLHLNNEQVDLIKPIVTSTEQDCELIGSNEALSETEKTAEEQARRAEETTALEAVLTPEQFSQYTAQPTPSKANINTSRSSVKQGR